MATTCKDVNGVCAFAIQIEEHEGTYEDPFGVIAQIDEIFSTYLKERDSPA